MNTNTNSISTPSILIKHGYHYLELIGEGSNGKTYKARNLKTEEIVAIKALKFGECLKNYELFKRESEVLQSIQIEGVPKFREYIYNESEFTECWLVQDFIDGQDVFKMLSNKGRLREIEALNIISKTAEIVKQLQTLYAPPIIHRDIKPSNILIDSENQVYLIDFGAVANPQRRSLNSTVAGTVGYMAPEQLLGDCTLQSDYYALGATLLHMLTGIAPSEFKSDGFKLQYETQLKKIVPDIHPETIKLLDSLLQPHASDRPQNAGELNDLISAALAGFSQIDLKQGHPKDSSLKLSIVNITGCMAGFIIIFPIILAIIDLDLRVFFIFFSIILSIVLIFVIIKAASHASENNRPQRKDANRERPARQNHDPLTDGNPVQTTKGVVVALFDNVVEYYFNLHGEDYVNSQLITKSYKSARELKLGDSVDILYEYDQDKLQSKLLLPKS